MIVIILQYENIKTREGDSMGQIRNSAS